MRFFIALEIPLESKAEIEEVQQKLYRLIPDAHLTDPDKLHLTIAFLGEQPDEAQEILTGIIKSSVEKVKPFQITPAYIDGFPNLHHPHTLWVGVKGDIDKLLLIRERIKDKLVASGLLIDERRYIPHIAIAKLKNTDINEKLEVELEKIMAVFFEEIRISSIKLFESVADEGFHHHNTLAEIELK